MRIVRFLPILFLIGLGRLHAQNTFVAEGTIVDAQTNDPVIGATIRAAGTNRGTYSDTRGRFRLPLPSGTHTLEVISLGYEKATRTVSAGSAKLTISLKPTPIELGGVEVSAGMSIDEIVQLAINRKEENQGKVKTFQGLLYSKFSIGIEGEAFGKLEDRARNIIMETFSRTYYDHERGPRIEIIQRRQTANVPSSENFLAIGNFFSFYSDDIQLLNAEVMSPLSVDAFSRYSYSLKGRTTYDNQTVYIVDVLPTTRLFPAFVGTMKIVKGTYDVIEIDLRPTPETAISFVRDLHFVQKFEKFPGDIWQPTLLQVTGQANVEIIKGLAEIEAHIDVNSIVTEGRVNEPLPDSVYADEQVITAAPTADSARSEFWENNALSEQSERERAIYQKMDSIVSATDSTQGFSEGDFRFSYSPYLDFNRVGSITAGAGVSPGLGPITLDLTGAYSFGLKEPVGEATITIEPFVRRNFSTYLFGTAFSRMEPAGNDRSIPRLLNTITASLFHRDYYDYFRADGWRAGLGMELTIPTPVRLPISLEASMERSRHFALENATDRSIFVHEPFRPNPPIVPGSFQIMRGELGLGSPNAIVIASSSSAGIDAAFTALLGKEYERDVSFNSFDGTLLLTTPTFSTGYFPMELKIRIDAGQGDSTLPPQYQFRMRTAASVIGSFGSFYSAPIGVFGGTSYVAVSAEHNFSDILWRRIELPTFEGRGIEIIVSAAAGKFWQKAPLGYAPTNGEWYTEVGFGIGKIPLFISNVAFLRFDARWGIGPLGAGKFGVVLGLSSPF